MNTRILGGIGIAALAVVPLLGLGNYHLHILITVLIWGFVYTSWSIMGRFGMVSLGHGAFLGVGAYVATMLWNTMGLSPWVGIPVAMLVSMAMALLVGYPCFRFRIVGHYFALVTLALGEVVRLTIVGLRDQTGGSLGMTVTGVPEGTSLLALQFGDRSTFFYVALLVWLGGLVIWRLVDRSMLRYALEASSEDEDAAASVGVNVTRAKLMILMISAAMTTLGGALYAQYQMYINPETVSGIAISLQIVFAVIAGGLFTQLGPTVGAVFTLLLAETLRVTFGHDIHGLDGTIYGLLLVLFIIYMPKGITGSIMAGLTRRRRPTPAAAPAE
ncbi:branched-chain amino acid ABC transporter permease [Roseococcus suduntuyensis]|uniref:Branched-chain amino acid transport system permease protein n=1 Tax=Roseococcus suduntuyensis TaxID=455361 RepID=A0A840AEY2_9PROT|nr:branched-chain amino acid ABC transporter permease [Roseococcus suduntuyensis]MBB3899106.1 branched-chain amino acid transport system permease protein [Roseococcus suduntuyensis]